LEEFVAKLEQEGSQKSRTLLFAGAWNDIDDSTFDDLTKPYKLSPEKRKKN
jgi:hypothetical protein